MHVALILHPLLCPFHEYRSPKTHHYKMHEINCTMSPFRKTQTRLFFFSFQVSWLRHNDVGLLSVGKYKYIRDERFQILHEPHSKDWVLVIKAVKYSDQGLYECQVNTSPMLRKSIFLNVVGKYYVLHVLGMHAR